MGAVLALPARRAEGQAGMDEAAVILLVNADAQLGRELLEQLCADGYRTLHARTALHAHALARSHTIRAVLLGVLDVRRGALQLLAAIRHGTAVGASPEHSPWDEQVPVIVLGIRTDELDLLRAFEAGADDFIAHPPSYLELRVRLRALLRRAEQPHRPRLLSVGALEIDTSAHLVRIAAMPVALSRLEYELLVHLARDPSRVFSKQELLRAVWGYGSRAAARTVDSHASRLRRKLEAAGAPGLVVNVWATGYRLT